MLNDLLAKNQSSDKLFVEDVFSTWLYTGNGSSSLSITNGIDLAGKGGLVWLKKRSASGDNNFYDTARGVTKGLFSNLTNAESTLANGLTAFSASGFTVGSDATINGSGASQASWTFRKAPKFFDVVTWTGSGGSRAISHALNSTPGCIIIKRTDTTDNWYVVHRSATNGFSNYGILNSTAAFAPGSEISSVGVNSFTVSAFYNSSGSTWVAYLFAHDDTADGVIQCGSYVGTGTAGVNITLGWEPQFLLVKNTSSVADWRTIDIMRAFTGNSGGDLLLSSNSSAADTPATRCRPTATGFEITANNAADFNTSGSTFIYMAIRRGPMRTPTSGTSVFDPIARSGTGGTGVIVSSTITPDTVIVQKRNATSYSGRVYDRLRGVGYVAGVQNDSNQLITSSTAAEGVISNGLTRFDLMNSFGVNGDVTVNGSGGTYINWAFRRAPSFFDTICYTGTGVARTVSHNLGVAPELMIVKKRNDVGAWPVYSASIGNTKYLLLNQTAAEATGSTYWNNTSPTATAFTVGTITTANESGFNYVAYLFASCPGVSKVGSYTGTGTTQQINCGFTAGARFVLIKRTDSTGDWYVYDSARGIVAGNDPYLLLNSTAAEVTNTDYVDAYSAGFELSSTAPAALNANGGTYIYLAIA